MGDEAKAVELVSVSAGSHGSTLSNLDLDYPGARCFLYPLGKQRLKHSLLPAVCWECLVCFEDLLPRA